MPQSKGNRYTPYKQATTAQVNPQDQGQRGHSRPQASGSQVHRGSQSSGSQTNRSAQASKNTVKHTVTSLKKGQTKLQSKKDTNPFGHTSTVSKKGKTKRQPTTDTEDSQQGSCKSPSPIQQHDIDMLNGDADFNNGNQHSRGNSEEEHGNQFHEEDEAVNRTQSDDQEPSQHMSRVKAKGHADVVGSPPTDDDGGLDLLASRMSGLKLQSFNRIINRFKLDEEHTAMGRHLCNVTSPEDQFHTIMITMLSLHEELENLYGQMNEAEKAPEPSQKKRASSKPTPWKDEDHSDLKDAVRTWAWRTIMDGDIQAYTAKKDSNDILLPLSLFEKVMTGILTESTEWKKQHLPPKFGVGPELKSARAFTTLVNDVLKQVRKDFETILITNVKFPDRVAPPVDASVPKLNSIIIKLYQKKHSYVGGKLLAETDIIKQTDHLQRTRYSWLRMQAIHWGMNLSKYAPKTLWNVIDDKLDDLRSESRRYRYAFFALCLQRDCKRINGKKNFAQLKTSTSFSLPTEEEIEHEIHNLDETHGQEVLPNEEFFASDHEEAPDDSESEELE